MNTVGSGIPWRMGALSWRLMLGVLGFSVLASGQRSDGPETALDDRPNSISAPASVARFDEEPVCVSTVGVYGDDHPDAASRITELLAAVPPDARVRFENRARSGPSPDAPAHYFVFVSFFDAFRTVTARLVDVETGEVLGATEAESDDGLVPWLGRTVPEVIERFGHSTSGMTPDGDVEVEWGGCRCLPYYVDAPRGRYAAKAGYGHLLAPRYSPDYPGWRTFEASACLPYYAPLFAAGFEDLVSVMGHCRFSASAETRFGFAAVFVKVIPGPIRVICDGRNPVAAGLPDEIYEVSTDDTVHLVSSIPAPHAERAEHVYRFLRDPHRRVAQVMVSVEDGCGGCGDVMVVGRSHTGEPKTVIQPVPRLPWSFHAEPQEIYTTALGLIEVEEIRIRTYEGYYHQIQVYRATWDCPDELLRFNGPGPGG